MVVMKFRNSSESWRSRCGWDSCAGSEPQRKSSATEVQMIIRCGRIRELAMLRIECFALKLQPKRKAFCTVRLRQRTAGFESRYRYAFALLWPKCNHKSCANLIYFSELQDEKPLINPASH